MTKIGGTIKIIKIGLVFMILFLGITIFKLKASTTQYGMAFADIDIPAFNGLYSSSSYHKIDDSLQTLYTDRAIDNWYPFSKREVLTRLRHTTAPVSETSWLDAGIGTTISFTENTNKFGVFAINFKNKKWAASHTNYWGNWQFNR